MEWEGERGLGLTSLVTSSATECVRKVGGYLGWEKGEGALGGLEFISGFKEEGHWCNTDEMIN
jgi:hypothetical protein